VCASSLLLVDLQQVAEQQQSHTPPATVVLVDAMLYKHIQLSYSWLQRCVLMHPLLSRPAFVQQRPWMHHLSAH
jgi:hypothetical protein